MDKIIISFTSKQLIHATEDLTFTTNFVVVPITRVPWDTSIIIRQYCH